MAKNKPIVTHTETLCFAILHLEKELREMERKCSGVAGLEDILQNYRNQFCPKIEALKEMYRFETGSEYF